MFGDITLTQILIIIGVLLVSMSVHEAMHAYTGLKLGDDTAAEQGRISFNPLRHIDPFMTVILPTITLLLFQFPILAAKPVPFNPDRVKFDEFGAALIAAAGPFSNLVLAALGGVVVAVTSLDVFTPISVVETIVSTFIQLNVALFVFNILPIPPLDGSRVLYAFAPEPLQRLLAAIEPFGLFVVFGLVLAGVLLPVISTLNETILQLIL